MQRSEQVNIACVLKLVSRLETQVSSQLQLKSQFRVNYHFNVWNKACRTILIACHVQKRIKTNTIASVFYSQSKSNLQYVQQGFQSEMSLGHVTSEPQNLISFVCYYSTVEEYCLCLWIIPFLPSHDDCVTWQNQGHTVGTLIWSELILP